MWDLKRNDTTETDSDLEKELMVAGGRGEGGVWEFGRDMYAQLYLKQITNKVLL